jgi:Rieske Fe-S protein
MKLPHAKTMWSLASRALLAVSALAVLFAVALYLKPSELGAIPGEDWVRVAPLDSLLLGEARLVLHETRPFYVVRVDERKLVSVSAVCTHLRCTLRWERGERVFSCPCHGDRWNLSGAVIHGPATRPLETHTVSVRAGEVWVHL